MRNLFLSALTAVVFLSCSKEAAPGDATSGIALNATSVVSRASDNTWAQNDKVGIFMLRQGAVVYANCQYNNSAAAGLTATLAPVDAASTIYFPIAATPTVDFVAYYPFRAGQNTLSYAVSVANQADQNALDLITADRVNGRDKNNPNVTFAFKHRLTKLIVTTVVGNGLTAVDLAGMTVKITGQKTAATFDLGTNTLTASGSASDITLKNTVDAVSYEATILPVAAVAGRAVVFTLTSGDQFVWDIADKVFAEGEKHIFQITLKRQTGVFTGTITDWTVVNGTGNAE